MCPLIIVRMLGPEIGNGNVAVAAAVAPAQMSANTRLGRLDIWVITVVQDHELYIAKERFDRIVIGAAFRQADPVQVQLPHHPPGFARFAGMGTVLIERDPQRHIGMPAAHLAHKPADMLGRFARQHHPMHLAADRVVAHKQVEEASCFLGARQDEALGRGIAPAAVSLHGNRLDIEKQQPAVAWQMLENPADPGQDGGALGILADEFALDAPEVDIVFLALAAGVPAQWTSRYGP